ncbi:hypothetical protein AURDEDRAFT_163545 [Auricularia subglabra TFB-10046 SS5]|nr:hypothetical protein AURDEDRAFT_163545 [Auricularia subglabra TFB-10046 SS5]
MSIPLAPIQVPSGRHPSSNSSPLDDEDEEAALYELRETAPWKRRLRRLLESSNSSPAAFVVHVVTTALIIFSALVTILETLPMFHTRGDRVWFGMETSLVALFTVECIARVLAWPSSWSAFFGWFSSFFAIINLMAILRYYIEIALQAGTILHPPYFPSPPRIPPVPLQQHAAPHDRGRVPRVRVKRSKDIMLALSFFLVTTLTSSFFRPRTHSLGSPDDAIIFSANPQSVANRRRRELLRRTSSSFETPRPSTEGAGVDQLASLSKDLWRLQNLVEKQSADMVLPMNIVKNVTSQGRVPLQ